MPRPADPGCSRSSSLNGQATVIGIDVGGRRKGFHAVALRDGLLAGELASADPAALSHWCREEMQALLIGIDAPCRWSTDGRARPCERQLNACGIRCFASPTRAAALHHPSDYYGWMRMGADLYAALEPSHPLLGSLPASDLPLRGLPSTGALRAGGLPTHGPACFETFPHAITWMLQGGQASAADKRRQRSALLQRYGIDPAAFSSIDWIDAALCALAADQLGRGAPCQAFGEAASGLIVVPRGPSSAAARAMAARS